MRCEKCDKETILLQVTLPNKEKTPTETFWGWIWRVLGFKRDDITVCYSCFLKEVNGGHKNGNKKAS